MTNEEALMEVQKSVKPKFSEEKKKKRKWENAFQKWCNNQSSIGIHALGKCGYGSMCDYCFDSSYGRPCVRALNQMIKETGRIIDYDDYDFESVW